MKKKWLTTALLTLLILAGCSEKEYTPKEISAETDVCEVCNMSISYLDYAGQIVFKNDDHQVFDDIGCLMEYIIDNGEDDIGAAFIKDEATKNWINVKNAIYIYNANYWTPMNYGVLAFGDEAAATEYMKQNGEAKKLQYDDLLTFEWGIHSHE
ncbi:MAG: nitrous oxide reductase accessory protein NosL [Lysinibacillus sp.]